MLFTEIEPRRGGGVARGQGLQLSDAARTAHARPPAVRADALAAAASAGRGGGQAPVQPDPRAAQRLGGESLADHPLAAAR